MGRGVNLIDFHPFFCVSLGADAIMSEDLRKVGVSTLSVNWQFESKKCSYLISYLSRSPEFSGADIVVDKHYNGPIMGKRCERKLLQMV
jgi:hypothetical protein